MQQGSSQVSSESIVSTVRPQKDMKEVIILSAVVLFLGGLLAAAWFYSQSSDEGKITTATTDKLENTNVSDLLRKTTVVSQAQASAIQITTPVVSTADIVHADIYFEVGRKGLTDEGKAQLAMHADLLKQHEDYGVLIQGYTDQQGSASYNKQLGMKRAETVKAELINAGIPEHRIKAVSLGEEGVLCADTSDICRHMNRRVHLEVRKIGREHMVLPPASTTTFETSDSSIDSPSPMVDGGSTIQSISPTSSDPTATSESVSGS
jgi:peptidoglycan-associated lipoprotein